MPIFEVTDPETGMTLELEGDSPPTEAELMEVFASYQPEAEYGLMSAVEPVMTVASAIPAEIAAGARAGFETAKGALGFGTEDIGAAVAETRQKYTYMPRTPEGQAGLQALGEGVQAVVDVAEVPLSGLGGLAELATGQGLQQAVETIEGVQDDGVSRTLGERVYEETGSPLAATAAYATPTFLMEMTALKAAPTVGRTTKQAAKTTVKQAKNFTHKVTNGANKAYKNVLDEPDVKFFDETGAITAEGVDALKKAEDAGADLVKVADKVTENLQAEGVLTAEEAARFNLFHKRGVQPTRAQVTQAGTDFMEQQELAKTSNALSEVLANQDERLADLAREGIESIGPSANDLADTNASVYAAIDDVVSAADAEVSKAYQAARMESTGIPDIPVDNLVQTLKSNVGNNQITKGLISSIRTELKNRGILDGWKRTGKVNAADAEGIRQYMNSLYDSTTPKGRMILRELKDSLDSDVEKVVGRDIFFEARKSKKDFQKLIERQKRNKFDKARGSLLEDIVDNKIPEEKIVTKLKAARNADLEKLKTFFLEDSGDGGIQAWNNVKSQVLRDALNEAIGTMGKAEGGIAKFNVGKFRGQMRKLKDSGKYKILFNAAERELIDDIIKIGELRIPTSGAVMGLGPTAQAVKDVANNVVKGELRRQIPGVDNLATIRDAFKSREAIQRQLDPLMETRRAVSAQ